MASDVASRRAVQVRDAHPEGDAQACAAIYAPYVIDTAISFEHEAPLAHAMAERMHAAYVWLVAREGSRTVGYAYGSRHQQRTAYRWSADVAIYIERDRHRMGVGRVLYSCLVARLRDAGLWTLCAGVTQPNAASDGLHRAMGFTEVGIYRRIGFKAGAWQDVRWWQLDLRPGEAGPPSELDLPWR